MNLQEIIDKANKLKAEIEALRPISPEQEGRILQKFRLDWNYHSNAIEGNTLSLGETRAFLLHGVTAKGKPFKDYLDIKGHNEAITYLEEFVRGEGFLTEAEIREIHKILLVEPYEVAALTPDGQPTKRRITLGQYKTWPNHVKTSTGAIHYYATPEETPARMGDLMKWYRSEAEKGDLHPLILAATFHFQFVNIHPFDDGNGRMARLLMNLILMQAGYVPVITRLESREDYLLALEKADAGELEDFIILVGEGLINSLELYLRGARGESIEELEDFDKKIALLQKKIEADLSIIAKDEAHTIQRRLRLFDNLIIPLLEKLVFRVEKFKVFFDELSGWAIYEWDSSKDMIGTDQPRIVLNKLFEVTRSDLAVNYIQVNLELIGFVKDKGFSIILGMFFNFRQDEFEIRYALRESAQMRADQELINSNYQILYTENEINEFIVLIVDKVYKMIEQQDKA